MTETKAVLDWLTALCAEADAHRAQGDLSFLNRMTANAGIKHYFDNVHCLRSVQAGQWMDWYPTQWHEARAAYEATVAAQEQAALGGRVAALETDIAFIKDALKQLLAPTTTKRK